MEQEPKIEQVWPWMDLFDCLKHILNYFPLLFYLSCLRSCLNTLFCHDAIEYSKFLSVIMKHTFQKWLILKCFVIKIVFYENNCTYSCCHVAPCRLHQHVPSNSIGIQGNCCTKSLNGKLVDMLIPKKAVDLEGVNQPTSIQRNHQRLSFRVFQGLDKLHNAPDEFHDDLSQTRFRVGIAGSGKEANHEGVILWEGSQHVLRLWKKTISEDEVIEKSTMWN